MTATFQPNALRGDQRITFIGQTGSGKSVVSRYLLKLARARGWRIVIVDPKKDWMKYLGKMYKYAEKGLGTIDSPHLVSTFNPKLGVQIFQPLEWDGTCERFFKDIIATRNTIVYIDEITQLATANKVPREINLIWTQGRSINVGGWCSTQKPLGIPGIIKDQSEVWFLFRINSKKHRQIVEGHMPLDDTPEVVDRPLPKFWFYYWEDSMPAPVLVRPLKLGGKAA
jgi:hypothetical protein